MEEQNPQKTGTPVWIKAISLCAVAAACLCAVFGRVLSGRCIFYHDSTQAFSLSELYFRHISHFSLPLWSPHLNAGQPLWPTLEAFPFFDPVQLLLRMLCAMLRLPAIITGEIATIGWLFSFAFGGLLLSRHITKNWWINLTVFMLLFGGPTAWAVPGQLNLLLPFRYAPYLLLACMDWLDAPDAKNAITLAVIFVLSLAGYQSGYMLLFALVFAAAYALMKPRRPQPPKPADFAPPPCIAATGLCVTAVAGLKLVSLIPLAPTFVKSWTYNPISFINGLMLQPAHTFVWHGSAMTGGAAVMLMLAPLALIATRLRYKTSHTGEALGNTWLITTAIMTIVSLGLFGLAGYLRGGHYLFKLRNWGYDLTAVQLGITQLMALGAAQLETGIPQRDRRFWISYAAIYIVLLTLCLCNGGIGTIDSIFLLPFMILPPFLFILFCIYRSGLLIFAVSAALLCVQFCCLPRLAPDNPGTAQPSAQLQSAPPQNREWAYDPAPHFPFVMLGPALGDKQYATMPDWMFSITPQKETALSALAIDLVQLPRYNLLRKNIDDARAKKILGVTAPIVHCVSGAIPATDEADALQKLKTLAPQQLDDTAVIEGPLPQSAQSGGKVTADIRVTHYEEAKTGLEVNANRDAVLVYSDNWDEDWKVYLDGKPVPLLVANLTNKAVFVPGGKHAVEFKYFPLRYVITFWLRVLFYIFAAGWLVFLFKNRNTENALS